ncbi:putative phosphatidylinositol 3-and 4-kinase domain-containing protein [Neospora caninum Liverpool]|uniref:non-specific serine/threonine protein kinase n=1 Tax=Neospora caninum (strain Liverpool) TaxID=572307 RepID=F0VQM6_NEOCL|nr:putative phosphatidylinositol 3-and 4-kinase domain-containing protein [Neospora caninum Liverpool]CBZ56023.1 putative phosphatidylinositol 3-and 4-kinase domain-containing protein [Neospora caninum Liverpool]|eukprot:XP_003886049.1 putative phosphatidylinositol 3-and 4-kinase domain-containing protein [Neospora caninum Liverpool]
MALQRLREVSVRPANASALLTPVGPAPLFLLVSQALINANEEDLSAVTDCLSAWHTSNFLIQRMHSDNDWLATLTLQQEQLRNLESERAQLGAQLRQSRTSDLDFPAVQADWSVASLTVEANGNLDAADAGRSPVARQRRRLLRTRLREVEEQLYATKIQMADALGIIGLHSLRESLLASLRFSSSASPLPYTPAYPSWSSTLSFHCSPPRFQGIWCRAGGADPSTAAGTRPLWASIRETCTRFGEDREDAGADCGESSRAWLEKKFECLWRLHKWDCGETTPLGASRTEPWSSLDSGGEQRDSFSPCPPDSCGETGQNLSLFNGCIYSTLSLIHGAASCRPSSSLPPRASSASQTSNSDVRALPSCLEGRAPHVAAFRRHTRHCAVPTTGTLEGDDEDDEDEQGDTYDEAEELDHGATSQRVFNTILTRLRAVQTSRHALAIALERLASTAQSASSAVSSFGPSSANAPDPSLSRRLLSAYVELSMAHALQLATTLNLRLHQGEPCQDAQCDAFEHLQSSWANDLAVAAGPPAACSSAAASSPVSSLPFFLEPLVSLQTSILEAAIPSFHIYPRAPCSGEFCEHWAPRGTHAGTGSVHDQQATRGTERRRRDRIELEGARACGCHVRRPAARHLLFLAEMKRERGDWRGSLENLLQAKAHLLQLQRDRERPSWEAFPWQLAKTLYLAGDRSGSLNIASRLCQPKNWPMLPFQNLNATSAAGPSCATSCGGAGAPAAGDARPSHGCSPQASFKSHSFANRTSSLWETKPVSRTEDLDGLAVQKFRGAMIDALCSCGEWQFRGRWATEATVRRRYFSLALRLGPVSGSLEPNQRLATLIDDQLQSYSDYKHSVPSLVMADLRRKEKAEIESLLQQLSSAFEERGEEEQTRRAHAQQKFLQHHIDILLQKQRVLEREREKEYQERTQWALEAVTLYATCLKDPFLPHAAKTTSRVLSLWFEWGDDVPEMNAALHRLLIAPFTSAQPQHRQDAGHSSSPFDSSFSSAQRMNEEDDSRVGGPPDLRHLLPFVYQIASRLGSPAESPFQRTLRDLLVTTARQYPFQCLYQLVAIRNGRRIPPGHRGADSFTVQQDKIDAAQDVLGRIADSSPALKFVVAAVECLVDFYNDLCLLDFDDETRTVQKKQRSLPLLQRGSSQSFPRRLTPQEQMIRLPSFQKLEEFSALLPIPTVALPRDRLVPFQTPETLSRFKSAPDYLLHLSSYIHSLHPYCLSDFPGDRLRMSVKVIGSGITKPKLLCIWDRQGRKHKQCCKGREDVRQDRVAQQLFSMLNQVFLEAPSTLEKNFYLRTYAVVPFSPAVGILEWVNDAVTLAQYLIGSPENGYHGAHARYRPQDWTFSACRHKLRLAREKALAQRRQLLSRGAGDDGAQQKGQQPTAVSRADMGPDPLVESLVQAYDEICGHFKPVLHYFFLEHFPSADAWYAQRQRYRRTLAVSSMVSYIIGLGDRHTNNILLDIASGDLIHIDFGVVFEQGKLLAVPELVPFRLTRDLVDGLGCLGVAGCFKRDCETTMEVLRRVSPLVVSIVEVLLFDPLYRWCLDPRRILQESDKSLALAPSRPGSDAKTGGPKRGRDATSRGRGPTSTTSTLPVAERSRRKRGRLEAVPEQIPSGSALLDGGTKGEAKRDPEEAVDEARGKQSAKDIPIVEDILTKAEGNMNAKRAVLTVRRKLEGYEEGEIAQLRVNAHVARLVNAAQDRTALAQMFVGWAPWV